LQRSLKRDSFSKAYFYYREVINLDIIIRSATIDDAEKVARIKIEGLQTAYRGIIDDSFLNSMDINEEIEKRKNNIENGVDIIVAELNNEIVGFCLYRNYIKELDRLFPPQILITWNKNNKDIEIATDLYNTIGQRYFSKKSYEDHFNVQYPSAPTLPLKEFLWKNKELVENLMLKNYQTFISKKSEIIDLLN